MIFALPIRRAAMKEEQGTVAVALLKTFGGAWMDWMSQTATPCSNRQCKHERF